MGVLSCHVRMMETGYQNASLANLFGLQYVVIRKPKPMDTVTLNYNWQMNGTNAFSIYTNSTDLVDDRSARQAVSSVLRFLTRMGILKYNNHSGYIASVINEYDLLPVKTYDAGFYRHLKNPGDPVFHGDLIAQVIDPYEGEVKSEIYSQTDGIVFLRIPDRWLREMRLYIRLYEECMSSYCLILTDMLQ